MELSGGDGFMSSMTKNPVMLAALAATALALGACGSSDDNDKSGGGGGSNASKQDKAYEGALKFAKCMRDNGIDMPDPQKASGGGILQKMGGSKDAPVNEVKMQAAQKKCQHFMETGGGDRRSPGDDKQARATFLAYSKCMRTHGVPDFPDPKFTANGVQLSIRSKDGSGPNLNPDAPAFKAAEKQCQPLMAKLQAERPGQ
jgi:hypothetical protein